MAWTNGLVSVTRHQTNKKVEKQVFFVFSHFKPSSLVPTPPPTHAVKRGGGWGWGTKKQSVCGFPILCPLRHKMDNK